MHTDYRCAEDVSILMTAAEIDFTVKSLAERLNAHYGPICGAKNPL